MRKSEMVNEDVPMKYYNAMPMEHFLAYCESHSETPRALFSKEQIAQLLDLAGYHDKAEDVMQNWKSWISIDLTDMVDEVRKKQIEMGEHQKSKNEMTTEEVKTVIADHAESMNGNDKESLEFINSTMDYLMYLKRFLELEPHEKIAFAEAVDGGNLNDAERKKLNRMTSDEEKDHYLGEIARTNYFRRCAWLGYLHGEKNYDKPFITRPDDGLLLPPLPDVIHISIEGLKELYKLGVDDGSSTTTNAYMDSNFKIIGADKAIRKIVNKYLATT